MDEVNKIYCVFAEYDSDASDRLLSLQRRLYERGFVGRQSRVTPQHITLGTYDDKEAVETIAARLARIAERIVPFTVSIVGTGQFGLDVLFAIPTPNLELLRLQSFFSDGISNGMDWVSHSTLLIDEPSEIQRAIP